jgi:hypothetical protein
MPHSGLTFARRWATASVTVSAFMLLVALSSPRTPLWPLIVLNWLIFVPGGLLMMRNANNKSGDPEVTRGLIFQFTFALLAFAICGNLAFYVSNSVISPNDRPAGNAATD